MDWGLCHVFVGGSESRLASSQQCVAASHSGSVDTSPTAATTTSTASTTAAAAAAVCNVSLWSSHDVQMWLHNNDLDSLTDRFLRSVVVVHLSPAIFLHPIFKYLCKKVYTWWVRQFWLVNECCLLSTVDVLPCWTCHQSVTVWGSLHSDGRSDSQIIARFEVTSQMLCNHLAVNGWRGCYGMCDMVHVSVDRMTWHEVVSVAKVFAVHHLWWWRMLMCVWWQFCVGEGR